MDSFYDFTHCTICVHHNQNLFCLKRKWADKALVGSVENESEFIGGWTNEMNNGLCGGGVNWWGNEISWLLLLLIINASINGGKHLPCFVWSYFCIESLLRAYFEIPWVFYCKFFKPLNKKNFLGKWILKFRNKTSVLWKVVIVTSPWLPSL